MRHRFREALRIGLEQSVTPQAGRCRPGRTGLRRGLVLARRRRLLRDLSVADGDREPDQVGQPLVGQGHLTVAPRQYLGQPQHGRADFPALLQRQRVRGHQEILVLSVGEILDGQRHAFPEVPASYGALFTAPGDERGHAVHQQCGPAFA